MVTLDKSIQIAVSSARVWDALTALPDAPSWWPGIAEARWLSAHGPVRVGSRWHAVRDDLGLRLASDHAVTAAVPGRRLAWTQERGDFVAHDVHFELTPLPDGGTRVRLRARIELPFILPRLLREDDVAAHYSRGLDDALLNLKDHLEGRHPPTGVGSAGFMGSPTAHAPHDGGAGGFHSDAVHAR